jgi:hypothetical protein
MTIIYSNPGEYLPINTAREHLCGYYNQKRGCVNAEILVDSKTGHQVCSGCDRVLSRSGLRLCDICECQFIDLTQYYDPKYEVNCTRCVNKYGL